MSQGRKPQGSGSQDLEPQSLGSQGPGSQGARVSDPGSQVLILDYLFESSIFRFQENIFNVNHLLFGNLIYLTNNVNLQLTR